MRFICRNGHLMVRTPVLALAFGPRTCKECLGEEYARTLRTRAEAAGLRWLDERWVKNPGLMTFQCQCGHEWKTPYLNIRRHLNCPRCVQARRRQSRAAMEEALRAIAASHGGEYLSRSKRPEHHHFRCAKGHQWEATSTRIKRGAWCYPCGHEQRGKRMLRTDNLARIHQAAQQRGGTCLDDIYHGMSHQYRFRCDAGHEWQANGNTVTTGSWCLKCYKLEHGLTLTIAQQHARERGGQCLSTEYKNISTPMHWLCDQGHAWYAPLLSIRQGHWCHVCHVLSRTWDPKKRARYLAVRH
ncbi:hypothetical protein [Pseudomonas sp. DWP3-1-2]|uniref:hypothetical protein n=1 Tax=Pseudomonas sp. DWP3-1-2 TaxID=2804645 RepID=UPI003CF355FF